MAFQHRVDFGRLEWQSPMTGVRHKILDQDGVRLRLVEYAKEMPPHWCERGHHGYLLAGRMEIEYDSGREVYGPGEGITIPDGPEHRHRATILSDTALVFFVEQA
jgi:quercetin dioxygenase-like cupin family protein